MITSTRLSRSAYTVARAESVLRKVARDATALLHAMVGDRVAGRALRRTIATATVTTRSAVAVARTALSALSAANLAATLDMDARIDVTMTTMTIFTTAGRHTTAAAAAVVVVAAAGGRAMIAAARGDTRDKTSTVDLDVITTMRTVLTEAKLRIDIRVRRVMRRLIPTIVAAARADADTNAPRLIPLAAMRVPVQTTMMRLWSMRAKTQSCTE